MPRGAPSAAWEWDLERLKEHIGYGNARPQARALWGTLEREYVDRPEVLVQLVRSTVEAGADLNDLQDALRRSSARTVETLIAFLRYDMLARKESPARPKTMLVSDIIEDLMKRGRSEDDN